MPQPPSHARHHHALVIHTRVRPLTFVHRTHFNCVAMHASLALPFHRGPGPAPTATRVPRLHRTRWRPPRPHGRFPTATFPAHAAPVPSGPACASPSPTQASSHSPHEHLPVHAAASSCSPSHGGLKVR
jgi:hypothetical protein